MNKDYFTIGEASNLEFKNYIQFLLYTGARRNEALEMTWEQINLKRKKIIIKGRKSNKDRTVDVVPTLSKVLRSMERNGDKLFSYKEVSMFLLLKKHLKLAKIKKAVKLHTMRHTFASQLVMQGVPLYVIQKLLGHSSISQTEKYAHLSPVALKSGIHKLPY